MVVQSAISMRCMIEIITANYFVWQPLGYCLPPIHIRTAICSNAQFNWLANKTIPISKFHKFVFVSYCFIGCDDITECLECWIEQYAIDAVQISTRKQAIEQRKQRHLILLCHGRRVCKEKLERKRGKYWKIIIYTSSMGLRFFKFHPFAWRR